MNEFLKLCKTIYETNANNGWWEHRLNIPKKMEESGLFSDEEMEYVSSLMADQLTLLQISELVEAMEARRIRKVNPDLESFYKALKDGVDYKTAFKEHVKDRYWTEKADALIRLADEAGSQGVDLMELVELTNKNNSMRGNRHGGKIS